MRRLASVVLLAMALAACSSTPPAPVIERTPSKPAPAKPAAKAPAEKDWRPDNYIVKKGDTLYAIGLEFGYDYKEIARLNNISPPYVIRQGQQLKLKEAAKTAEAKPAAPAPENKSGSDVVVSPLSTDAAPATTQAAGEPPLLTEPKALREPYSEQALATPPAKAAAVASTAKPADTTKTDATKPESAKTETAKAESAKPDSDKADAAGGDDEAIDWAWPANGKLVGGFSDNSKGVDIAGNQGQPVLAAAPGKVIYSGADLRGYGKLVIIKHNKTYLSVYAHNSQIVVKEGQQVTKGQKIAEMGSSDTDKVKLHFEIRKQGKSVDPAKYLSGMPG